MSNDDVKVSKVKGRPFLHWIGKKPLEKVKSFPAQHIETYDPTGSLNNEQVDEVWKDWPQKYPKGGLLFHGENKEVLGHLLANGFRSKVRLIYIDPPFMSNADYVRKVKIRGKQVDINEPSVFQQQIYTDIWQNDNYLQFMYERLQLLKELLTDDGSIYLHCDWHKGHHLRMLLDEVFGEDNFVDEIIWSYGSPSGGRSKGTKFVKNHDTIIHYANSYHNRLENKIKLPYSDKYINSWFKWTDEHGRKYQRRMRGRDNDGNIVWERQYLDESPGMPCPTAWVDILQVYADPRAYKDDNVSELDFQYDTQKPEPLIQRIIKHSSNVNDIVLDCFCGSGVTPTVSQLLGRKWIACDINKGAIQLTSKRLQYHINNQQNEFILEKSDLSTPYTVWRVNDYDLQIQHNEYVNLACDAIGVQRIKTDIFFDGVLGNKLVKIIPVQHPLTPLDLQEIEQELENRKSEDRDIVVVCLGKELAADEWLESWNRLRKTAGLNRIEVIELKTDPKYGGMLKHKPATAKINIKRSENQVEIKVVDYISPSIIQRLSNQEGVLSVEINDWRAVVDCILIDQDYNGEVFNISISDIPEKRAETVSGEYIITTDGRVAVKIIDLLGEEVFVLEER